MMVIILRQAGGALAITRGRMGTCVDTGVHKWIPV